MSEIVLEMKDICKSFGSIPVLKSVNFSLKKGEVHALVGGNGAGKSTLMKIMTGIYSLDSGEIYIDGEHCKIQNASDAKKHGIDMVFQELSLIQTMTISENIFLGEEITKHGLRSAKIMNEETAKLLRRLDINVEPSMHVNQLSVGISQMVEIAKALSKDGRILILDEPTASLSDSETVNLFRIIEQLKSEGVSIVYISHRMNEILQVADRVTILRDGEYITTESAKETSLEKIVSFMVNEDKENKFEWLEREYDKNCEDLLTVANLKINEKISDISFSIKPKEIVGIAGLMGSGRTEILETLFGLREKEAGDIVLSGRKINSKNSSQAIQSGFALIPEDRRKQGLILSHSVKENIVLPIAEKLTFLKIFSNEKSANKIVNENVKDLDIVTSSIHKEVSLLSGGNQQKVVIVKWLDTKPKVMLLDEPTAGVDIAAKAEIIKIIRDFADKGNGVLFVSSEITELMAVCDRIITMFDGKITGDIDRKDIENEEALQSAIQRN